MDVNPSATLHVEGWSLKRSDSAVIAVPEGGPGRAVLVVSLSVFPRPLWGNVGRCFLFQVVNEESGTLVYSASKELGLNDNGHRRDARLPLWPYGPGSLTAAVWADCGLEVHATVEVVPAELAAELPPPLEP